MPQLYRVAGRIYTHFRRSTMNSPMTIAPLSHTITRTFLLYLPLVPSSCLLRGYPLLPLPRRYRDFDTGEGMFVTHDFGWEDHAYTLLQVRMRGEVLCVLFIERRWAFPFYICLLTYPPPFDLEKLQRFYPAAAPVLDKEFSLTFNLTYKNFGEVKVRAEWCVGAG